MLKKVTLISLFKNFIMVWAVIITLFHLYSSVFGIYESFYLRILHLSSLILLYYLVAIEKALNDNGYKKYLNYVWIAVTLSVFGYLIINYDYLVTERFMYVTPLTPLERILGILLIVLLLETSRRIIGNVLPVVLLTFLGYYIAGPYLPGILYHSGFSLDKLLDVLYLTPEGTFGMPLGVSATIIVMFIIFGAFLSATKFGDLISDFSMGLAGGLRGGPAKVAVMASALMGMISGSSNANVVATGAITIPLMKKIGYKPHFAGAVEAASSCGGQIMPPIMGAAIFLMVEYTGIPYFEILKYAIFPSLLYFIAILTMVHLEALKLDLKGLPKNELPDWKAAIKSKGHLVISIFILVALLARGYGPSYAGFYSILSLILISLLRNSTRLTLNKFLGALEKAAKNTITIAVSCAVAGCIIGIVSLTGIGMRFTASILDLAGGNMFFALVLAMLAAIILGMGLPTTAAYVLMIALVIPALTNLGVELYIAHLFAVYFSVISLITPPVAITSYAAAGIANANVMATSWTAMRLGLSAYIVPFMFVYNPQLLLVGDTLDVVIAVISAIIGVILLSSGLQGYMYRKSNYFEIALSIVGALLLIQSGVFYDLIGYAIFILIFFLQKSFKVNKQL